MALEIKMPALTPTMQDGTLARWLVQPGDSVERGQVLAEIETDKSVLELEAEDAGVVGTLLVEEGTEGVAVDTTLTTLLEPGESPPESAAQESAAQAAPATPVESSGQDLTPAAETREPAGSPDQDARVRATPAARRRAREEGIELHGIQGSGPGGRITGEDVQAYTVSADSAVAQEAGEETVALSMLGKTMAKRMTESKRTIPHLYCSVDINVEALECMRTGLGEYTLNDFLLRALALALREVPEMNVQYRDGALVRLSRVDLAMAVAVEGGLVTPVLRGADTMTLAQLAAESRRLAERARAGRLAPEEYQGGGFTVSNVGMLGIDQSWPIINPPQAGILGVGRARLLPVAAVEGLAMARLIKATLAADHRVIDGVIAGRFLTTLRDYLQSPQRILH